MKTPHLKLHLNKWNLQGGWVGKFRPPLANAF